MSHLSLFIILTWASSAVFAGGINEYAQSLEKESNELREEIVRLKMTNEEIKKSFVQPSEVKQIQQCERAAEKRFKDGYPGRADEAYTVKDGLPKRNYEEEIAKLQAENAQLRTKLSIAVCYGRFSLGVIRVTQIKDISRDDLIKNIDTLWSVASKAVKEIEGGKK